jgi:hypothetical protein
MSYLAPRHRKFQARRRAAAIDAYCAHINPGLRIIAVALALLAAGIVAQQSTRTWLISFESLTDVTQLDMP